MNYLLREEALEHDRRGTILTCLETNLKVKSELIIMLAHQF